MLLEIGKIKRTKKFKYLGEWLEHNLAKKAAFFTRVNRVAMSFTVPEVKTLHYGHSSRIPVYHGVLLNRRGLVENLEIKERRIL